MNIKDIVLQDIEDAKEDDYTSYIDDVSQHGCQSGMVSDLIYYDDTMKFYKEHEKEIWAMINSLYDDCYGNGAEMVCDKCYEIFGEKWDNEDMLIEESQNQNLLAWFGYEEVANQLQNQSA